MSFACFVRAGYRSLLILTSACASKPSFFAIDAHVSSAAATCCPAPERGPGPGCIPMAGKNSCSQQGPSCGAFGLRSGRSQSNCKITNDAP
jgi:hypothetical protein